MSRHLRMGAWTGVLAGLPTAVVAVVADLLGGRGLDGTARVAAALGLHDGSLAGAALVLVGGPLLGVTVGLLLALLPLRVANAGTGLALGLAAGAALFALARASSHASPLASALLALALLGGLLAGFLYSRYARTQRRGAGPRPFGAR